jgi:hypothetical protein
MVPGYFEYEVEQLSEVKRKEIENRQAELFKVGEDSPLKGFDKKTSIGYKPGDEFFDCRLS